MRPKISIFINDIRDRSAHSEEYALNALRTQTLANQIEIFIINQDQEINLKKAHGDYILITDTDNIYHHDAIEQILARIDQNNKPDMLLFNLRGTWEEDQDRRNIFPSGQIPYYIVPFNEYHTDTIADACSQTLIKFNALNAACLVSRKLLCRNRLLKWDTNTLQYLSRCAMLFAKRPYIMSPYIGIHIIAPNTGAHDYGDYIGRRIAEFKFVRNIARKYHLHDYINEISEHINNLTMNQSRLGRGARLARYDYIHKIGIHLVDHCNLNCKSCSHFSCLARAGDFTLNVQDFKKEARRLSQITKRKVEIMELLGGEPLLHPDVISVMKIARRYFPKTTIRMITNGILLPKQTPEFWKTVRRNNILISPTKYPIRVDWDSITETAKKHGVDIHFFGGTAYYQKHMYHKPLDLSGGQDILRSYLNCLHTTCIELYHGHIYHCPICAYIKYFNREFRKNLRLSSGDYIDIFDKNITADDIYDFCARPVPFCRYCNSCATTDGHPWTTTKKDINEWTIHQP